VTALEGKAALVTGGTSGIGLAIAERLSRDGASVVVTGRDERRGRAAEERLGRGARFVAADAGDESAVDRSVRFAVETLGRLDLLVNNAGIALTERLIDTPVAQFDRLMAANVRGCFLYARACMPALAETKGSMVFIASDAGLRGEQPIGAYSVTKAAVVMMSKMLALDGASAGVRSNCVCPGATAPGMLHIGPAGDPERGDDASAWTVPPLGRIGRADDVASAVAFLAGDEAGFVSGAVLLVDGANGAGLTA
jgi:NAD(P)-dependent dehydrogenase (short-subunit alcohol dehydrogenase family)